MSLPRPLDDNNKTNLNLSETCPVQSDHLIDMQQLRGNLWYNAAALGGKAAMCDPFTAANNIFRYNTGANILPPSVSPTSGWFVFFPFGPNYDCFHDEGEDYCSQFNERGKRGLTELDERVANDNLENDPYTDETLWMLKSDLYEKLDENPELQDSLQVMAAFYEDMQGSTTAAFKNVDDEQLMLYALDSNLVAQLQADHAQINSLMALVQDGLEQLGDSTLATAQRQAIIVSISEYRQSISDLFIDHSTAFELAATSKWIIADEAQTINSGITTTELIEANQKAVNDTYLATIGKDVDEFTVDQVDVLFEVANQCPMLGGNAVFKARSLYGLINDVYHFDDSLLCAPFGIDVKSLREERSNRLSVVPNPATDEATLILGQPLEVAGEILLCNAIGESVMRMIVPVDTPRLTFDLSSLAPGIYHYNVQTRTEAIGSGKLTIVR